MSNQSEDFYFDYLNTIDLIKIFFNKKIRSINYFEKSKFLTFFLTFLRIRKIKINKINTETSNLVKREKIYYWEHFTIMDELQSKIIDAKFINQMNEFDRVFCRESAIIYLKKRICSLIQKDCMNMAIIDSLNSDNNKFYFSKSVSFLQKNHYLSNRTKINLIYQNQFYFKTKLLLKRFLKLLYLNIIYIFNIKKEIRTKDLQTVALLESSGQKNNFYERGDPEWSLRDNSDIQYDILSLSNKDIKDSIFLSKNNIRYLNVFNIKPKTGLKISFLKKIKTKKFLHIFKLTNGFINKYIDIEKANLIFDSMLYAQYFSNSNCKKFVYLDPYRTETDVVNFVKDLLRIKTIMIQYSFLKNDKSPHMTTFPNHMLLFSKKFKSLFIPKIYFKKSLMPKIEYGNYIFNKVNFDNYLYIEKFKNKIEKQKKYVIGILDESFGHALISKDYYEKFIINLINFNRKYPKYIFLLKPQFTRNSLIKIFHNNKIIVNAFEEKIIDELISNYETRNQVFPGALSLLSDVTIGFFFGGTASLEASFRTRSIMIDIYPLKNQTSNYFRNIFDDKDILFDNLDQSLNAIKDYSDTKNSIGDWSKLYDYIFENNDFQNFDIENYIKNL